MKTYKFKKHLFKRIVSPNFMLTIVLTTFSVLLSIVINTAYADSEKKVAITEHDWGKQGGIKVLSIRQSAAGYMLDFRYKVIDPAKAALFIDRGNKPSLNVLKNGSILQVPVSSKIGPLRQSAQLAKAGKSYFMFFANPGRMVKPGDKVKLNIGDFNSKTLTVE